jgi:hypothetical protein
MTNNLCCRPIYRRCFDQSVQFIAGEWASWPADHAGSEPAKTLLGHQAQLLLAAGNPDTEAAPVSRRVTFHQAHSAPLMEDLRQWMETQFAEHKTEPNAGLGKAISYLLRHWTKLTLFLRLQGAPLDNNIVEKSIEEGNSAPKECALL